MVNHKLIFLIGYKTKKPIKQTVNLIARKDNISFEYAVTLVLNHKEIKKEPQRIKKIKTFINKYNWEGINFLSEENDLDENSER